MYNTNFNFALSMFNVENVSECMQQQNVGNVFFIEKCSAWAFAVMLSLVPLGFATFFTRDAPIRFFALSSKSFDFEYLQIQSQDKG